MPDKHEVTAVYTKDGGKTWENIVGPDGHKNGPHDHITVDDRGNVKNEIIRTSPGGSDKNYSSGSSGGSGGGGGSNK